MAISVVMPALELTQETGKLVSWRKKEGEAVAKGDTLLEIETDKAVVEVEALADGFLAGVQAKEGDVIPVGQTIAWIVEKGESAPAAEASAATPAASAAPAAVRAGETKAAPSDGAASGARTRISPKARRLASELHVDLDNVRGSGPGGEILASDIEAAAKLPAPGSVTPSPVSGSLESLTAIARLMAERTTQSWTTVPHFFLAREVDASALNETREMLAASAPASSAVKITHTDLLTALVARVLVRHPHMNASWTPDGIRLHAEVNIGIAIAVNDGVIAAVIPSAHTASIAEIAAQRRDLAERAKSGKSRPQDLTGATFTISNLGMFQIDSFTAIIPPQQAAILAVGAIADRVVAIDGQPAVRSMMTLTLSSDHRVVDGARSALFLNDLARAIAQPQKHLR
ncbi:MAG: dihydrolipoamide acetyltransferase family protein [Candidatus Acidiferrales bacterium]